MKLVLTAKVLYGLIKNDIREYIECLKDMVATAERYPLIDPTDVATLSVMRWEDLENELVKEAVKVTITDIDNKLVTKDYDYNRDSVFTKKIIN